MRVYPGIDKKKKKRVAKRVTRLTYMSNLVSGLSDPYYFAVSHPPYKDFFF